MQTALGPYVTSVSCNGEAHAARPRHRRAAGGGRGVISSHDRVTAAVTSSDGETEAPGAHRMEAAATPAASPALKTGLACRGRAPSAVPAAWRGRREGSHLRPKL